MTMFSMKPKFDLAAFLADSTPKKGGSRSNRGSTGRPYTPRASKETPEAGKAAPEAKATED